MKRFFASRLWRERLLLTGFVVLVVLTWAGSVEERGRDWWSRRQATRAELTAQQVWLDNAAVIEAQAAAAARSFEPDKVVNATRLVGELMQMAGATGLKIEISAQQTEHTAQFAFHTVQVSARAADLPTLLRFYAELGCRAPYIALEQVTLATDRIKPAQLNASLRVVSVELAR